MLAPKTKVLKMNGNINSTAFTLESTAQILIRCFWMGTALLIFWFGAFLVGGHLSYEFHQPLWSGLTRHEFDLINLGGMAIVKLGIFVLFLLPYLSIRMVLRSNQRSA